MAQQINRYEVKRQRKSRKQYGIKYCLFGNLHSFHFHSPSKAQAQPDFFHAAPVTSSVLFYFYNSTSSFCFSILCLSA